MSVVACSNSGDGPSFEVDLRKQVYRADFGAAQGTLPDIACSSVDASPCNSESVAGVNAAVTGTPTNVVLTVGCDASSGRCYAEATARIAASVDVQLDEGFIGKLQGRLVSFIRSADLVYAVSENTLTFEVPHIDVYVGPAGVTRETDPGVVPVGRTVSLAPQTTLTDGHLIVEDGSPARATMENAIRGQQPFVLVLVLSPKLLAGSTVPAGTIEVDVTPKLSIGF